MTNGNAVAPAIYFFDPQHIERLRVRLAADLRTDDVKFEADPLFVYEEGELRRSGDFVINGIVWIGAQTVFEMMSTAHNIDTSKKFTGVDSPGHWGWQRPNPNNQNLIAWTNDDIPVVVLPVIDPHQPPRPAAPGKIWNETLAGWTEVDANDPVVANFGTVLLALARIEALLKGGSK
jgi:hypothetical protein